MRRIPVPDAAIRIIQVPETGQIDRTFTKFRHLADVWVNSLSQAHAHEGRGLSPFRS
jgi:hypothetical protein